MNDFWNKQIDSIWNRKAPQEETIFLNILSMFLFNKYDDRISTLYTELGEEDFYKVIKILGGQTIELPTEEDYKDISICSLCYYYLEIQQLTWNQIHELIPFKNISSIKYGKWISKLSKDSLKELNQMFKELDSKGGYYGLREFS